MEADRVTEWERARNRNDAVGVFKANAEGFTYFASTAATVREGQGQALGSPTTFKPADIHSVHIGSNLSPELSEIPENGTPVKTANVMEAEEEKQREPPRRSRPLTTLPLPQGFVPVDSIEE